ncbi:hypothetical protein GCM10011320_56130 [Neoroseomonas lacus]|uniref:Uncharacterized protein n=1 Tax=Neoroseomonas lacus TaxID=287609 RepID=A0A917NYL0_9PROT|nr:hypothetical protein GCM10011320_56130 [Neoroseomonas lacus]
MLPRSRREVCALICLGQLLWLDAIVTLAGVSSQSATDLIALGVGGAIGFLTAGVLYARRFRR